MNCLENISRITFSPQLVKTLTELYTYKGKDFFYEKQLADYMKGIVQDTIEKDAIYAGKIFGLNVKENRERLVVVNDSEPKTKDEKMLANLKKIFRIVQDKGEELTIDDNEFLKLSNIIFQDVKDINFKTRQVENEKAGFLENKKNVSNRDLLAKELKMYKDIINGKKVEDTQAITNLYVDLLHTDIFTEHNDFMALMIEYCLLFKSRFNVFKYISFFECYYNNLKEFQTYTDEDGLKWETGFADTQNLNGKLIEIMIDGYKETEAMLERKNFDHGTGKKDTVMSAIMHLPQTFSKADVKKACPRFSESTIQRALIELRDEGKIKPNGTGRSASWTKIVHNEQFQSSYNQMTIEELLNGQNN